MVEAACIFGMNLPPKRIRSQLPLDLSTLSRSAGPVVIAKIGVLNASSSGTLGYETLLGTTATLSLSGDNVAITHTITAG